MNKTDGIGLSGQFTLIAQHSDGEVFAVRDILNTITNSGMDEVAQLLCGEGGTAFDYVGLGSDSTAAAATDTELAAEIDYTSTGAAARVQDASPETATDKIATIAAAFTFTDAYELKEVGLFNAETTGDMLARQVFAAINVANGDSLTATWNITVGV